MNKRHPLLVAGAMLALVMPAFASAATTLYGTRALFNAANPGVPTETFEAANVAAGSATSYSGTLSSATNNSVFATGSVRPGFLLTTTTAAGVLQPTGDIYVGNGFGGNPTKGVSSNLFSDNLNLGFAPSITAFGIDLEGFGGVNGPWVVNLRSGASTIATFNLATGGFFGVTSTIAFDSVYLDKPDTGGVLDNLSFGVAASVPEPASWALMIVGFGMVGASVRRRSHSQALRS